MSVKSPSVALASRATLSARRAPSIQSTAIARRCSEARQQQSASSSSRRVSAKADVFAYDTVTAVFTTFNTLLLLPWLLMVFLPNLDFTRSIIRSNIFLYVFCAMFLYLFVAATAEALNAGANLGDEIQFLFLEAVAGLSPHLPSSLLVGLFVWSTLLFDRSPVPGALDASVVKHSCIHTEFTHAAAPCKRCSLRRASPHAM